MKYKTYYGAQMYVWAPPHRSVVVSAVENDKKSKKENKKYTMGPKFMLGPHLATWLSYLLLRIIKVNITSEKERKDIPWGQMNV